MRRWYRCLAHGKAPGTAMFSVAIPHFARAGANGQHLDIRALFQTEEPGIGSQS